jgi:hypothetical protein
MDNCVDNRLLGFKEMSQQETGNVMCDANLHIRQPCDKTKSRNNKAFGKMVKQKGL